MTTSTIIAIEEQINELNREICTLESAMRDLRDGFLRDGTLSCLIEASRINVCYSVLVTRRSMLKEQMYV